MPTLADFADEFMAFQASPAASRKGANKPGELREKRRVLDNHLIPSMGKLRLDEIRARHVDRYVTAKHKQGLSSSSITNHLIVLKRMLNVAKRWDLIERAPHIPTPKKPHRTDFLSTDESRLLLDAVPESWKLVVLMALRTGLRLGELRGLRWMDVDLDNARIRVTQNITDAGVGSPKSGKGRTVPIAEDLLEALAEVTPGKPTELVFGRADGSAFGRTTLRRVLERAAKEVDLFDQHERINVHLLRHTFASQAVLAGVPIRVVQEWLGHSDISITMRYAHLSPGGQHNMINRLISPVRETRGAH